MKTATKVAELLSGLLLVLFALSTPHWELRPVLLSVIEALAAFFVAWSFPKRPSASVVAVALATVIVASAVWQTITNGIDVPHMDSPVVGFAFFPLAFLVAAQLVAAYAVLRHRKAGA